MLSTATQLPAYARAVLVTIAYPDQFLYPLTFDEICTRCLRIELKDTTLSVNKITDAIAVLLTAKLIQSQVHLSKTYYFLQGRSDLVQTRLGRARIAQQKEAQMAQLLRFLVKLPSVHAVYLTGSQAMNSADEESDIDFMIVTAPQRLWMTRILVSIFAQLQGKRRSWNNEEPGSWCFNLWLDTDHLKVVASKQDAYRAHEVFQAKLLWEKNRVGELFKNKNKWIDKYFFNFEEAAVKTLRATTPLSSPVVLRSNIVADGIDWLAWKFQAMYMKRHQTTEKVGRGFAFFHPRDTATLIKDGWLSSLERVLSKEQAAAILQPYVRT